MPREPSSKRTVRSPCFIARSSLGKERATAPKGCTPVKIEPIDARRDFHAHGAGTPVKFTVRFDAPAFLRQRTHDVWHALSGQFHQTIAPCNAVAKTKLPKASFRGLFSFYIPLYQTPPFSLKTLGRMTFADTALPS